jgi:hypothetical protein
MADEYYESVRKLLTSSAPLREGADKQEIFWSVVDGVASVIDGATGVPAAGPTSTGLQVIASTIKAKGEREGVETTPNPWFVFNGQDEGGTEATKKYLRHRTFKSIGGGAIAVAGALASTATYVDVGGILQHGNATGSTAAHIYRLKAIADAYKKSKTISEWLKTILIMKSIKAGVRGTNLAGASIPVPYVGLATGLVAAAVKIGVKLTMTRVCLATAADVHWRAFQEQAIGGRMNGSKTGPASKIVYELFARRGATRILGKYDVDAFIKGPCGWMAISDKLLLI